VAVDSRQLLLVTIALLTLYVIGVGGTTATAIRIRDAWRHRKLAEDALLPRTQGEVVLSAPSIPRALGTLRIIGWAAFVPALVLAVFADRAYPWVPPVVVLVMVALNAFYFGAMQNMGERLTLTPDGFRVGARGAGRTVRWIHVTEFTGARVGAFSAMKMSEVGEWQNPDLKPNVIFFRLNRALTRSKKSLLHRLLGFTYYDGVIRNAFGVPTEQLLRAMRDWQRQALDAEDLPLRPVRKLPRR
jgi:hypothetical protein